MIHVVAEVAQGYDGDLEVARTLLLAGAGAGADAVKFQLVFADDIAAPCYEHYRLFQRAEMPAASWQRLRALAGERGIDFVLDVFGPRGAELCRRLLPDAVKLHTTSLFDRSMLRFALDGPWRVLVSTGGLHADELGELAATIRASACHARGEAALLFGFQAEPTGLAMNNLSRIPAIRAASGLEVGFMDHTASAQPNPSAVSLVAIGLGVRLFERHITLAQCLGMRDSVSALAPDRFAAYVGDLRDGFTALGSADLALTAEEQRYRAKAVRIVTAARDLAAGTRLADGDLVLRRHGAADASCAPFRPETVSGRMLARAVAAGAPITYGCLR